MHVASILSISAIWILVGYGDYKYFMLHFLYIQLTCAKVEAA